jgi:virginiamycin B lyase
VSSTNSLAAVIVKDAVSQGIGKAAAAPVTIAADTGPSIIEYSIPTANSDPESITAGPDGNLWFTENGGNKIANLTTAGVFTEYSLPTAKSRPWGITAGPDGNLWFIERGTNRIGRITPSGALTEFPFPTGGGLPLTGGLPMGRTAISGLPACMR